MAVATYTTDLTDSGNELDLCESNALWSEISGRSSGGADATEGDYYLQGSACVSQSFGAATGQTAGICMDYGSNFTFGTGHCLFMWQILLAPNAINTWALGGMRIGLGPSNGNFQYYNAMGNDFGRYPYGGWTNTAIYPSYAGGADQTDGSGFGNYRWVASLPYTIASVSKGNPHGVDAIRKGRGQFNVLNGQAGAYGTFAGMAAANDAQSARWGLFQKQGIVYLWKGLMALGASGTIVDFRDSNVNISVDDTPRTYAAFNRIEIANASSKVYWTNVGITAANASGLSKGQLEMLAAADVQFDGCTFTDMSTFVFLSTSVVIGTVFRRCSAITTTGGSWLGSVVAASTVAADASAFAWNSSSDTDGKLDDMVFTKGTNAHHAIQLGTATPADITLRGITFTGFNASDGQNDSVLYLADKGSDTVWSITANGCTGTVSYKKARAGDTVTVTYDQVTITIEVRDKSGSLITDATEITLVKSSDLSVLKHAEDVTSGSTSYLYEYAGDVTCYVNVLSIDNYVPRTVEPVVLTADDQTLVVQLDDERGRYYNP